MRPEDEEKRQRWVALRAREQQEDNLASLMDRLEELETTLGQLMNDYEKSYGQKGRLYHPENEKSSDTAKGENIFPLRDVRKSGIFTK